MKNSAKNMKTYQTPERVRRDGLYADLPSCEVNPRRVNFYGHFPRGRRHGRKKKNPLRRLFGRAGAFFRGLVK